MDINKVLRLDGWKNILTGLGNSGYDKKTGNVITWERMTEEDCATLFDGSDIARTICEDLPNDAMREGYELTFPEPRDDLDSWIVDEKDRLGVDEALIEAATWARVFGGAVIIPIPVDIKKLEEPLNRKTNGSIESLLVLNKFELSYADLEENIKSRNFGKPKSYTIAATGVSSAGQRVHHSHVIRFDGSRLTRRNFQSNNYWHDSVLNTTRDAIRDYDSGMSALATTLSDFSVGVYKLRGLHQQLAQGNDEAIIKRMQIVSLTRSIARAIVIDAENEDFTYQDRTMAGVSDAINRLAGRLVVASKMPHTKLLGESPAGSNATGNSTTMSWYDLVASWQTNYLKQRMISLWDAMFSQPNAPTGGQIPTGYSFRFMPLWQAPESEMVANRKSQAETDQIYIQNGVVDPEVVAKSRFGSGEYSFETDYEPYDSAPGADPAVQAPSPEPTV